MTIRISAAALCRIVIDGRYLLGYNKSRLAAGKRVLSPLGGALEFDDSARDFLLRLGAQFDRPESTDIRLTLPDRSLDQFEEWFRARRERECSPLRELREELLDEYHVAGRWVDPEIRPAGLHRTDGTTDRPGFAGRPTRRFIELYDVTFSSDWTNALSNASRDERSDLKLVTADYIATRPADVADTATLLLAENSGSTGSEAGFLIPSR